MTRHWTGEDLNLLRVLYGKGKSIAYLSDVLRRTPAAVRLQASRLGLRRGSAKKENGQDLLAELAAVLKGGSAPRDPLLVDLFDRLHP